MAANRRPPPPSRMVAATLEADLADLLGGEPGVALLGEVASARSIPSRKRLRRPSSFRPPLRSGRSDLGVTGTHMISRGMPPGSRGVDGRYNPPSAQVPGPTRGRGPRGRRPPGGVPAAALSVAPVVATSSTRRTTIRRQRRGRRNAGVPPPLGGGPRPPGPPPAGGEEPGTRRPAGGAHGPGEQLGLVKAPLSPRRGGGGRPGDDAPGTSGAQGREPVGELR